MRPVGEVDERDAIAHADGERARGTASRSSLRDDGALEVPGEAVTDPVAFTLAAGGRRRAPRRRAAHLAFGWMRVERMRTADHAVPGGRASRCAAGWRSTAPGSAPAGWRDSPATTRSRSTRARASSSSSSRRRASRSSGSCSPYPARAPRGCSSSRPSTARWSPGRPRSTRRTQRIGRSAPGPRGDPAQGGRHLPARSAEAEPIAAYAGLRPAGRGVNYLIPPPTPVPGSSTWRRSAPPASRRRWRSPSASAGSSPTLGVALTDPEPLEPGSPQPAYRARGGAERPTTGRDGWPRMRRDDPAARHRRGHLRRQGGAVRRRPAADRRGAA